MPRIVCGALMTPCTSGVAAYKVHITNRTTPIKTEAIKDFQI